MAENFLIAAFEKIIEIPVSVFLDIESFFISIFIESEPWMKNCDTSI